MKKILFIFGTRPEAIKIAPVINEFKKETSFEVKICITAQHREMLDQVLNFFGIKPNYDLNLMKYDQSLFDITSNILRALEKIIKNEKPDFIFVQGDTTTAFVGALAGFYENIKVSHIEAGLRSHNKFSPFPEEINRILVGHLADYHFVPTEKARDNLYKENIRKNVYVVGNTVIDALLLGLEIIKNEGEDKYYKFFDFIDFSKKIILVTVHRRESFGNPLINICYAIKELADEYENVEIVYPVHLNPNVRKPVNDILKGHKRIHVIEPLNYSNFIWLMSKSYIVLTDSGGIQEEAPSLGKPVLVLREVTERTEGIEAGTAILIGTKKVNILRGVKNLMDNRHEYEKMGKAVNPYGDGKSSKKIIKILMEENQ